MAVCTHFAVASPVEVSFLKEISMLLYESSSAMVKQIMILKNTF
jgi:hypothetical protein